MNLTHNFRNLSRINNFDFIRFIAACTVICSHSFDLTGLNSFEPLRVLTNSYITLGTLSLHVFFIISGFLIQQSFDRSSNLYSFIVARCVRILPALASMSFAVVFILGPFITYSATKEYFNNYNTYLYLINSFALKTFFQLPGVFEENPVAKLVNGSIWSLPLEVLFYSLIALSGQLKIIKSKWLSAVFISLFIVVILMLIGVDKFGLVVYHFKYFAIGVFFYKFRGKIVLNYYYLLLVVFICILTLSGSIHVNKQIKDIVLGITLAYFIFCFSYSKCILNNFSKYGDFSYGIYLWGFPVQQTLVQQMPNVSVIQLTIFSMPIVLILSVVSWHFVEKPMLDFKKLYTHKSLKISMSVFSFFYISHR